MQRRYFLKQRDPQVTDCILALITVSGLSSKGNSKDKILA